MNDVHSQHIEGTDANTIFGQVQTSERLVIKALQSVIAKKPANDIRSIVKSDLETCDVDNKELESTFLAAKSNRNYKGGGLESNSDRPLPPAQSNYFH